MSSAKFALDAIALTSDIQCKRFLHWKFFGSDLGVLCKGDSAKSVPGEQTFTIWTWIPRRSWKEVRVLISSRGDWSDRFSHTQSESFQSLMNTKGIVMTAGCKGCQTEQQQQTTRVVIKVILYAVWRCYGLINIPLWDCSLIWWEVLSWGLGVIKILIHVIISGTRFRF